MNLNELRLGNYVYGIDPNNKECGMVMCKVQCIYMDGAELSGIAVPICAEYIEPIELTESMLYKMIEGDKYCFYHLALELSYDRYRGFYYLTCNCGEYEISNNPIKYLHQLQNLYFAINGKELEVKL